MKNTVAKPQSKELAAAWSRHLSRKVNPSADVVGWPRANRIRNVSIFFLLLGIVVYTTGCQNLLVDHPSQPQVTSFASGLVAPLGLEADAKGQLWVTEAGSGTANDGQLTLVTPDGRKYPVIQGFTSKASPEGAIFGLNHVLLQGNTLWMLHGVEGRLYQFDITSFKLGDMPLQASNIAFEDIGKFVKDHDFPDDTGESDVFNLTVGPDGDLFIVDAGANAIIRRSAATKAFSVFSTIPPIIQPSGDTLEAVPTGIVFDGQKFLVSNFTGYPFPTGQATIYQYDLQGSESAYQTGLTTMTDIELGLDQQPVVVEYGIFNGQGFEDNSGSIVRSTAQSNTRLVSGLNFPNSIKRTGPNTYYVAQTFDGTIQKVTL
ncbi:ScyD/ScyE family protein [Spirosoma validum]|uniref:ScyD/ScyE family protein n=1 Tax=Spirosoma validum TaxID=2771355 RepID=A0A927B7T2_9BACT|nr:ScyD/ScyE family protein [Spirosoma validum]MBD2757295.1 ScyD/ScyE family protein [Spirosoma validum]